MGERKEGMCGKRADLYERKPCFMYSAEFGTGNGNLIRYPQSVCPLSF